MPHLPGSVDSLIKSDVSIVLNVFLLPSVSWWFFEGSDDRSRGRRCHASLGLSVLSGQFHCNPQTLPITSCLGNVITDLFLETDPGGRSRADMALTSPPVRVRYMTLISLGSNLGAMVEVAGVG